MEAQHRAAGSSDIVPDVAWPSQHGTAAGLVGFVVGIPTPLADINRVRLREHLPAYMVPSRIHKLKTMPMTANGKIDRTALTGMLDNKVF